MKAAQTREFGALQTGNGAEDARLLAVFELGLEPNHVEKGPEPVVLAQLSDSVGLHPRLMLVGEAKRLHRTMAQGVAPTLRHHLDRQAAVEIGCFPVVKGDLLACKQRSNESVVLFVCERTIDVSGGGAAGSRLVIARLQPGARHIDRIAVNDRCDGIEECKRALTCERRNRVGERRRCQRSRRDDDAVPSGRRYSCDLFAADVDQRVRVERRRDGGGKALTVDG